MQKFMGVWTSHVGLWRFQCISPLKILMILVLYPWDVLGVCYLCQKYSTVNMNQYSIFDFSTKTKRKKHYSLADFLRFLSQTPMRITHLTGQTERPLEYLPKNRSFKSVLYKHEAYWKNDCMSTRFEVSRSPATYIDILIFHLHGTLYQTNLAMNNLHAQVEHKPAICSVSQVK